MEILKQSRQERGILAFYDNVDDASCFIVGYVEVLFKNALLVATFDEMGVDDGFILLRFEDFFKIEKGSLYLKQLLKKSYFHPDFTLLSEKKGLIHKDGINSMIDTCKSYSILVTIQLIYGDYITGIISDYDGKALSITVYSVQGFCAGVVLIKKEDIRGIAFERNKEREIAVFVDKEY
ncbi:hypothetical protein H8744_06660 [Oscillospiraceae bacterium N12]|uniref:Uncharacterized protein n=1 Tax=Jilunia laotingensis TaxID=2763675 RepID=A0A926F2R7_9BACT|nr:hypothetical protein [Jilunia laotingensis]MBC8592940.1 hypothetical protein [Jilunia laotingensis]